MVIVERLNRHPVIFTIFVLGAIASIVGLIVYLWPTDSKSPNLINSLDKWGIINEYSAGDDDVIEGWLTVDTLTWGATIPLPPFNKPPDVDFWREDGSLIKKPNITEKTTDQFSITINNSDQTGRWIWRARGVKAGSPANNNLIVENPSSKEQFFIESYDTLELFDGNLTITLTSNVNFINAPIDLTVSSRGEMSKTYENISLGKKVFHGQYEITYLETQKRIINYVVVLRIIESNKT